MLYYYRELHKQYSITQPIDFSRYILNGKEGEGESGCSNEACEIEAYQSHGHPVECAIDVKGKKEC